MGKIEQNKKAVGGRLFKRYRYEGEMTTSFLLDYTLKGIKTQ